MSLLGAQTLCSAFDTVHATPESHLLFRVGTGFSPSRGIGAIRVPAAGAGLRPYGGRFALVSGRPYRWNHAQLQSNVTEILATWFQEPLSGVGVEDATAPAGRLVLEAPRPNPSRGAAALRFTLPRAGRARLVLMDLAGRHVRTLLDGAQPAGEHETAWDGRDERGAPARAGLYWARLEAGGEAAVRKLIRLE
jgi:hypothetical protein